MMDSEDLSSVSSLLQSNTYASQAHEAINSREKLISHLLAQRKCPKEGWDDLSIEMLLQRLSLMDSNNFISNCGLGEREARFASNLVAQRHYRMGHGIGRSGDIKEVQPKAAGSSLLNELCNSMVTDLIRTCGINSKTLSCLVVPMATGMSLVLCLLALRQTRPKAKYVIWPRIDQKSCFKSIITAGFIPIVIDCIMDNQDSHDGPSDALVSDMTKIKEQITSLGPENILCILTTTSCFAPRVPDNLIEISSLCHQLDVPHLVNNAYGIQSSKNMHLIQEASRTGRIDAFVQSTDKNFMVPVGGSVIATFNADFMKRISSSYPGRASGTPSMDLLITLLHLGVNGYHKLLKERKENMSYLREQLSCLATRYGEELLRTKDNHISCAMTLDSFSHLPKTQTQIGSQLFLRCVSGTRVVLNDGNSKSISGHSFKNWGSHSNDYKHTYLTAAATIGITRQDIDNFIKRFDQILGKLKLKTEP